MKNITTVLKNNFDLIFFLFNESLSILGIVTAFEAMKTEQYNNPFLLALPLSTVLWFFITYFVNTPYKDQFKKEIENLNTSPIIKVSYLAEIIIKFFAKLLTLILLAIVLIDFIIMFFISLKLVITPLSCFY